MKYILTTLAGFAVGFWRGAVAEANASDSVKSFRSQHRLERYGSLSERLGIDPLS